MIKYIPGTGIAMLLFCIAHSQPFTSGADPAEIKLPENNFTMISPVGKRNTGSGLADPANAAVNAGEAILYSGTIKKRRLHGSWRSWYDNQHLCDSGTFVKGIPNGEWRHWDINGQLVAIRHYDADKLLRVKNEIQRNHPRNVLYPLVSLFDKNSRRAKQYMEAGYSFAFATHRSGGLSLQQAVENNVTPGNTYRPLFDQCLHHGLYMNFFADGSLKDSGYYKNGLRDGIWIHREPAGGVYLLGVYKNGSKQGDWKQYDAKDKLIAIIFYNKKGEEDWRKKFRD